MTDETSPLIAALDKPIVETGKDQKRKISKQEDDFGWSSFPTIVDEVPDEPEVDNTEEVESLKETVRNLKKLIMPLLENLAQSADKGDTIYWPNRKKTIQDQINKINKLTKDI